MMMNIKQWKENKYGHQSSGQLSTIVGKTKANNDNVNFPTHHIYSATTVDIANEI